MNKTNFLLELFSEEIPAMMQKDAENGYKQIFEKYFARHEIGFDKVEVNVGPRRVSIKALGLPKELPAKELELKGPKLGAPDKAIEGFCKSNGASKDDLEVRVLESDPKQSEYYFLIKSTPARNIAKLLGDSLHEAISDYAWPKSMYWGDYKIKWVRPLKNILCIIDDGSSQSSAEVVDLEYGHLKANNLTFGHRFASSGSLEINSINEYEQILDKNFVILSRQKRLDMITEGLREAAKAKNLSIKNDPILLEEVAGLADYPKVLLGSIEEKFMQVPSQVLIASMRSHQKYFSCFNGQGESSGADGSFIQEGEFAPYFLFVSNVVSDDYTAVVEGNEKVLSARLSDALYFYNQDLKTSLKDKAAKLNKIVFHEKLGTLGDKVSRLCKLSLNIDKDNTDAAMAASLSKSDIVSEVVGEFPSLQGIMGYIYAKAEGQNQAVAELLRDQYKPAGAADSVPGSSSYLLSLCEKMDSLCGLMLAGIRPTGSKDPYSLRRMALGILRVIIENKVNIDLKDVIYFAVNNFDTKNTELEDPKKTCSEILLFIEERLKHYFKDRFESNLINACFDLNSDANILNNIAKLEALSAFMKNKQAESLVNSYKRVSNLLGSDIVSNSINDELFDCQEEHNLTSTMQELEKNIQDALDKGDYDKSFEILASLASPLAEFFDNVLIKGDNADLQSNRMAMLAQVRGKFQQVAKFDLL